MANFPTIGLGQAGQNAFNNKWAGYTPPVAPAPTPTAPTQPIAPKPSTLPTQPAQQGATVIPVTTMGSQQQINIPTQQQPMTAPVTMNYADQLMQQANADSQNTQVQDYQDKTVMQILDAYNNIAGESAYRAQVTQDSNINGLKQNLQNINNQILTKQAEISPSGTVISQQAVVAISSGTLTTRYTSSGIAMATGNGGSTVATLSNVTSTTFDIQWADPGGNVNGTPAIIYTVQA